MNDKQKKLFGRVPVVCDTTGLERARGELKDLMGLESGLTTREIELLEIFFEKTFLTDGEIKVIDDIYCRRI